MSKSLVSFVIVAAALTAPIAAFAQADSGISRAEVRAELVQLEKAGYNPASDHTHYPDALLAAEARIDALQGVNARAYGASVNGTSTSGTRGTLDTQGGTRPMYSHH
jgi:hypothetical protein